MFFRRCMLVEWNETNDLIEDEFVAEVFDIWSVADLMQTVFFFWFISSMIVESNRLGSNEQVGCMFEWAMINNSLRRGEDDDDDGYLDYLFVCGDRLCWASHKQSGSWQWVRDMPKERLVTVRDCRGVVPLYESILRWKGGSGTEVCMYVCMYQ